MSDAVHAFYGRKTNVSSCFDQATVLITGNTGFKGSWLSIWLMHLGARVVGLSSNIPTDPSHYVTAGLERRIEHVWGDIRDLKTCRDVMTHHRPDFVFHLAAQPLVRHSYLEPHETFVTNTMGTLNMLEAMRVCRHRCVGVFITSDKCYDNVEQVWGYRENDRLGGRDPYSGSKGAAELVIRSYIASFFNRDSLISVAVGRAGNVIGGGDWAVDRIIPDAIRSWSRGAVLTIRNPKATRPWQHVLEPLSGYLTLASRLTTDPEMIGEAFNFGPAADQNHSVQELLEEMRRHWPGGAWQDVSDPGAVHEAGLLKLCCDKALHQLGWQPLLRFPETVAMTAHWYRSFHEGNRNMWELTRSQIELYQEQDRQRGRIW